MNAVGKAFLWVVGGFFVLAAIGAMMGPSTSTPTKTASAPSSVSGTDPAPPAAPVPEPENAKLELLSANAMTEYGYNKTNGQVRNISGANLENVSAVVTWYTKNDEFVRTDDALIDFNPILPGQTSSFSTIGRGNPEADLYTVEFKKLFGGTIAMKDSRKKK